MRHLLNDLREASREEKRDYASTTAFCGCLWSLWDGSRDKEDIIGGTKGDGCNIYG